MGDFFLITAMASTAPHAFLMPFIVEAYVSFFILGLCTLCRDVRLCTLCVPGQKASDPLELELGTVVSYHVGAGN